MALAPSTIHMFSEAIFKGDVHTVIAQYDVEKSAAGKRAIIDLVTKIATGTAFHAFVLSQENENILMTLTTVTNNIGHRKLVEAVNSGFASAVENLLDVQRRQGNWLVPIANVLGLAHRLDRRVGGEAFTQIVTTAVARDTEIRIQDRMRVAARAVLRGLGEYRTDPRLADAVANGVKAAVRRSPINANELSVGPTS